MRRGRTETPPVRSRPPDRAQFGWIGVPVRIALEGNRLTDFQGQIIGFDRSWVKVRFGVKTPRPPEGTGVGLQFGPTGREATLPLRGIVWRVDPDGVMTVLLSLSTPEFQRLKSLAARVADERTAPLKPPPPPVGAHSPWVPPHPSPAEGAQTPSRRAPEESVEASGEPASPSPSLAAEVPAEAVGASAERASSLPDEGPKAAPVEPPPESSQPAPDYKGAARHFFEGLRAKPVNLSLWCALGATMYHLGKKKAAAEILQHVVRYERFDSPEVRLARSWLGRMGAVGEEEGEERHRAEPGAASPSGTRAERVEPPRARPAADPAPRTEKHPVEVRRKPSGRPAMLQDEFGYFEAAPQSPQRGLPTAPPQPRARRASPAEAAESRAKPPAQAPQGGIRVAGAARRGRSGPGPADQAALLAAQGNYAEAARLYADALRATPENASLWYALGVTLRHLNKPQEAVEALQRVIRHGEPESLVRLARLWLQRGGIGGPDRDGP